MEQYFSRIHEKNPILFIGLIFLISLIPSVFILSNNAPDLRHGQLAVLGNFFSFFVIAVVPVLETFACQAFPALLMDIFLISKNVRTILITIPFALGHIIPNQAIPSLINGISGGLILGICYLVCQRRSHSYAIIVTIFVHSAHNAVSLVLGD